MSDMVRRLRQLSVLCYLPASQSALAASVGGRGGYANDEGNPDHDPVLENPVETAGLGTAISEAEFEKPMESQSVPTVAAHSLELPQPESLSYVTLSVGRLGGETREIEVPKEASVDDIVQVLVQNEMFQPSQANRIKFVDFVSGSGVEGPPVGGWEDGSSLSAVDAPLNLSLIELIAGELRDLDADLKREGSKLPFVCKFERNFHEVEGQAKTLVRAMVERALSNMEGNSHGVLRTTRDESGLFEIRLADGDNDMMDFTEKDLVEVLKPRDFYDDEPSAQASGPRFTRNLFVDHRNSRPVMIRVSINGGRGSSFQVKFTFFARMESMDDAVEQKICTFELGTN